MEPPRRPKDDDSAKRKAELTETGKSAPREPTATPEEIAEWEKVGGCWGRAGEGDGEFQVASVRDVRVTDPAFGVAALGISVRRAIGAAVCEGAAKSVEGAGSRQTRGEGIVPDRARAAFTLVRCIPLLRVAGVQGLLSQGSSGPTLRLAAFRPSARARARVHTPACTAALACVQ